MLAFCPRSRESSKKSCCSLETFCTQAFWSKSFCSAITSMRLASWSSCSEISYTSYCGLSALTCKVETRSQQLSSIGDIVDWAMKSCREGPLTLFVDIRWFCDVLLSCLEDTCWSSVLMSCSSWLTLAMEVACDQETPPKPTARRVHSARLATKQTFHARARHGDPQASRRVNEASADVMAMTTGLLKNLFPLTTTVYVVLRI